MHCWFVLYYFILWKRCNKPLLLNGNRIDVCFFMSMLTVCCHKSIEITLLYPGFQCFRRDCKKRGTSLSFVWAVQLLGSGREITHNNKYRTLFTHTHTQMRARTHTLGRACARTHTYTDTHNQYQIYIELNKLQLGSSIFYRAQKTSAVTYFYFIYITEWKLI